MVIINNLFLFRYLVIILLIFIFANGIVSIKFCLVFRYTSYISYE